MRSPAPERTQGDAPLVRWACATRELAWLLAAALTPLIFNVHGSAPFDLAKAGLLRTLALVIATSACLGWWATDSPLPVRRLWTSLAGLGGPLAAYLAVTLLSVAFSVAPWQSLWGSHERAAGLATLAACLIVFVAVADGLESAPQRVRLFDLLVLGSIPIGGYALVQQLGLDPMDWKAFAGGRLATTLGNPIFAGSYLLLVAPVTLGRLLEVRGRDLGRSAACWLALALQAVAFFSAGSRGPLLAAALTLGMLALLVTLLRGQRRVAAGMLGTLLLSAVFVLVLNVPDGPLQPLRNSTSLYRISRLLDPTLQDPAARGRALIWQGVVKLCLPRPALVGPGGVTDRWAAYRPLVGYGPETLDTIFPAVYTAEFGRSERRDPSVETRPGEERAFFALPIPDRAHSEAFDRLAFSGWPGLLVHFGLFAAILQLGLRVLALRLGASPPGMASLALLLAGGLVAAGAASLLTREYAVVAAPLGMAVAWLLCACRLAARATTCELATAELGVLCALVGHFVEIHLGPVAIGSSLLFWVYTGVVASRLRPDREADRPQPAVIGSGLGAALLITLVYDFARWPGSGGATAWLSPLALALTTLGAAWLLFPGQDRRIAPALTAAFIPFQLFLLRPYETGDGSELPRLIRQYGWLFTDYVLWMAGLAIVCGALWARVGRRAWLRPSVTWALALAVAVYGLLGPVAADNLHRVARRLRLGGATRQALLLYEQASLRAPRDPFLATSLGEAYLESSRARAPVRPDWAEAAARAFARAQALTPLNPDHEAGQARLARRQAETTSVESAAGYADAARGHYEAAIAMSPHDPILLDEAADWDARCNRFEDAERKLRRSRELDSELEFTQAALGDLYVLRARAQPTEARSLYQSAATFYAIANTRRVSLKSLLGLGWARLQAGEPEKARTAFEQALRLSPPPEVAEDIHTLLAEANWRLGREIEGNAHAQQALQLAPAARRASLVERLRESHARATAVSR